MTLDKRTFENNVGKGENTGNQHFLLFPQCFLLFLLSFANAFDLNPSKILLLREELKWFWCSLSFIITEALEYDINLIGILETRPGCEMTKYSEGSS